MFFTLASAYVVFLVAVVSPGPDFAVTVQNSVRHGLRAGVWVAMGIAGGNFVQIGLVNFGLGALLAHSVIAFSIMKFAAAGYLCWIGVKALRSKPYAKDQAALETAVKCITDGAAFRQGMTANMLNPKAAMFWLSFFTLIVTPDMPSTVLWGFVGLLVVSVAAWFSLVALFLSRPRVREAFMRLGHWFDRVTGAVLIALGIKVALGQK